ncbi:HEAT repeat domain-containing protein [Candidatus Poribacteria bacterium]|nr:HEAT repeat domain-containing protein [Candidatus Poribacteria bacterium]
MRRRRPTGPTYTARLLDTPPTVSRVARSITHSLGRQSYEEPFHVASTLRTYGVRVLSALGDHATEALRALVYHLDPQVRVAVTEELVRHEDVEAIDPIQNLALKDEDDAVQETALLAVAALRKHAEEQPEPEPTEDAVVETGEDAEPAGRLIEVPLIESGEDVSSQIVVEPNDDSEEEDPDDD